MINGRARLSVGTIPAQEVAYLDCVRPRGAFIVGWIDFDPDKGERNVEHRRYALLLLHSGRVIASRGSDVRAIPEAIFSYIRKNSCS